MIRFYTFKWQTASKQAEAYGGFWKYSFPIGTLCSDASDINSMYAVSGSTFRFRTTWHCHTIRLTFMIMTILYSMKLIIETDETIYILPFAMHLPAKKQYKGLPFTSLFCMLLMQNKLICSWKQSNVIHPNYLPSGQKHRKHRSIFLEKCF